MSWIASRAGSGVNWVSKSVETDAVAVVSVLCTVDGGGDATGEAGRSAVTIRTEPLPIARGVAAESLVWSGSSTRAEIVATFTGEAYAALGFKTTTSDADSIGLRRPKW